MDAVPSLGAPLTVASTPRAAPRLFCKGWFGSSERALDPHARGGRVESSTQHSIGHGVRSHCRGGRSAFDPRFRQHRPLLGMHSWRNGGRSRHRHGRRNGMGVQVLPDAPPTVNDQRVGEPGRPCLPRTQEIGGSNPPALTNSALTAARDRVVPRTPVACSVQPGRAKVITGDGWLSSGRCRPN